MAENWKKGISQKWGTGMCCKTGNNCHFWSPVQHIRTLEGTTVLRTSKSWTNWNRQLFSDPAETWGHRANRCAPTLERQAGRSREPRFTGGSRGDKHQGRKTNYKRQIVWELKIPGRPSLRGNPYTFMSFPSRSPTRFSQWRWRTIPPSSSRGRKK